MSKEDVEALLVEMILDERLAAEIDQINGHIYLDKTIKKERNHNEDIELGRVADILAVTSNSFVLSSIW